jgi:hypothetical protein
VGEFVQRKLKRTDAQVTSSFGAKWEGPFIIETVNENGSYYLKKANKEVENHPTDGCDLTYYSPSRERVILPQQSAIYREGVYCHADITFES